MIYGHTELKKGVVIDLEGAPHQVLDSSHIAMGRGGAVMRTKLKNLRTGAVFDRSFRASDKIPSADVNRVNLQYLYKDASGYHFMNQETYDQVLLGDGLVGESAPYLVEGAKAVVMYHRTDPIGVDIGNNVHLKVAKTEPGAKGDTATAALKPATMETGLEVMVPLFINEGDVIKVDTRTGTYLERQK
jgi:elongation factor P